MNARMIVSWIGMPVVAMCLGSGPIAGASDPETHLVSNSADDRPSIESIRKDFESLRETSQDFITGGNRLQVHPRVGQAFQKAETDIADGLPSEAAKLAFEEDIKQLKTKLEGMQKASQQTASSKSKAAELVALLTKLCNEVDAYAPGQTGSTRTSGVITSDVPAAPESASYLIHKNTNWDEVMFSPDGKFVAGMDRVKLKKDPSVVNVIGVVGDETSSGYVFDVTTTRELRREAFFDPMQNFEYAGDGRTLVACSAPGAVHGNLKGERVAGGIMHDDGTVGGRATTFHMDLGPQEELMALKMNPGEPHMWASTTRGLFQCDNKLQYGHFPTPGAPLVAGHWSNPTLFSADGSVVVAWTDKDCLEAWDVKTGRHRCVIVDECLVGRRALSIALSADGSLLCADYARIKGRKLEVRETTVIIIADTSTGKILRQLPQNHADGICIACSADGKLVATGANDGYAFLWKMPEGQSLARFNCESTGVRALAIDPKAMTLATGTVGTKGTLRLWDISPYTHPQEKGKIVPATIASIVAPPCAPGRTMNHDEEESYLAMNCVRLFSEALKLGSAPDQDQAAIAAFNQTVFAQTRYVRNAKLDEGLAGIGEALPGLVNDLVRQQVARRTAVEDLFERQKELDAAKSLQMLNNIVMGGLGVIGALSGGSHEYTLKEVLPGQWQRTESGKANPELEQDGIMLLAKSQLNSAFASRQLEAVKKINDDEYQRAMKTAIEAEQADVKAVQAPLAALLDKYSMLPGDSKTDVATAINLDAWQKQIEARLGAPAPFVAIKAIQQAAARGGGSSTGDAKSPADQAKAISALTAYVPNDRTYDIDRADILAAAGDEALKGSQHLYGRRPWGSAPNDLAQLAVDLYGQALRYDTQDASGLLRQRRALALGQAGKLDDAIAEILEVKSLRGRMGSYWVDIARLQCANRKYDQGLESLEIAIERLWYHNIGEIRAYPELPVYESKFRDLLMVNVSAMSQILLDAEITIKNQGRFPLTNAQFRIGYEVRKVGHREMNVIVPTLAPYELYRVSIAGDVSRIANVAYTTDEGAGVISVTETPRPGEPRVRTGIRAKN